MTLRAHPALVLMLLASLLPSGAAAQSVDQNDLDLLEGAAPSETALSIFDTRRLKAAERVLASDSSNPTALTELGRHHASNYRWYANLIATKQPIGGGLRGSRDRAFEEAAAYYQNALASDHAHTPAARELFRLLIEDDRLDEAELQARHLTQAAPTSSDFWMLRGLVSQLRDRSDRAEEFFDRALALLPPNDAEKFVATTDFLVSEPEKSARNSDPARFDESFWANRDPLYLTRENERRADHFARMVYADLWYGSGDSPGWDSERGRIIVRYGIPVADLTFTGTLSRFNVLDFSDFDFVFEDQTRGGHYTLFSPKASAGSSWDFDYVIRAGEMERTLPERYRFNRIPQTPVKTRIAVFRGRDRASDVYVQYGVPVEDYGLVGLDLDPRSRIGGFVTSESGSVIVSSETAATGSFLSRDGRLFETGAFSFSLKPGRYRSSLEYLNSDRSAFGVVRDSLNVEPWPETGLAMSDVIIASEIDIPAGAEAGRQASGRSKADRITRSGFSISPDPWGVVDREQEALVYFEVYGVGVDRSGTRSYRIEATVERTEDRGPIGDIWSFLTGSKPTTVTISSITESALADDARFLALDLSSQAAGTYILTVRAEDTSTDARAERSREIRIVE